METKRKERNRALNFSAKILFTVALLLSLAACSSNNNLQPITPAQAAALYNPGGNAVAGNPNGNVTLVEFFDYQCHYCRKMLPVIQQLIKADPNLRVIYKEYVLFGPSSEIATRAALAAQLQNKYLAMHLAMMTATKPLNIEEIAHLAHTVGLDTSKLADDMNSPLITRQIKENNQLAAQLGINGVPAFIVANSHIANNPQDVEAKQLIWIGSASLLHLQKLITQVQ